MKYYKFYRPGPREKFPAGVKGFYFRYAPLVFIVDYERTGSKPSLVYMSKRDVDGCDCTWVDIHQIPPHCKPSTKAYFEKCTGGFNG